MVECADETPYDGSEVAGDGRAEQGLCDVHNHLLPGVDDGSRSLVETLTHLRTFRSEGVTDLVFTPHLLAGQLDRAGVEATLERHRERFADVLAGIGDDPTIPRLHLGQEIYAREPSDLADVLGRYDVGLGGGAALLVEFGFTPGFDGDGVVERVLAEGRRIVVAHPERYRYGGDDAIAAAFRWRDMGASLQVNGGSLLGLYTPEASTLADELLAAGAVDLVSSDHHGDYRAHSPAMTARALETEGYAASISALMGSGPRDVLPSRLEAGATPARSPGA